MSDGNFNWFENLGWKLSAQSEHSCHDCGEPATNPVEVSNGTDTDRGWHTWTDTEWLCDDCLEVWQKRNDGRR
jgi:hypothetical protein